MQKLRKKEEKDRVTASGQAQSTWGPKTSDSEASAQWDSK